MCAQGKGIESWYTDISGILCQNLCWTQAYLKIIVSAHLPPRLYNIPASYIRWSDWQHRIKLHRFCSYQITSNMITQKIWTFTTNTLQCLEESTKEDDSWDFSKCERLCPKGTISKHQDHLNTFTFIILWLIRLILLHNLF